jgi:riboflavin kinase / FMN adenylyltransferase
MIHVHNIEEVSLQDTWLTVGVFDGVHRGHQEIIRSLVAGARQASAKSVVVTFWPHPATVLGRGGVRCLTMDDERASLLDLLGVDVVVTHVFDGGLAATSARDFVGRLISHLGFKHFLIGYDFALGKDREGNRSRLIEIGKDLGYDVHVVPALSDESGVISSTEIRKLVATGEVSEAAKLLGHNYGLHGRVVHGDSRGRDLGFPTANVAYPPEKILPSNGVYACWAWAAGHRYRAAINVGVRPQFHDGSGAPLVEAYLLDFDGDLYGQDLRLEFAVRLRDERRFSSVNAMLHQIRLDVSQVREILPPD